MGCGLARKPPALHHALEAFAYGGPADVDVLASHKVRGRDGVADGEDGVVGDTEFFCFAFVGDAGSIKVTGEGGWELFPAFGADAQLERGGSVAVWLDLGDLYVVQPENREGDPLPMVIKLSRGERASE